MQASCSYRDQCLSVGAARSYKCSVKHSSSPQSLETLSRRRGIQIFLSTSPNFLSVSPLVARSSGGMLSASEGNSSSADETGFPQADAMRKTFKKMGRRNDWLSVIQKALLWVLTTLVRFFSWVMSCGQVLPGFVKPSPLQVLYRMCLVLAASMLMIIIISSVDGLLLQLYILGARRA